MEYIVTTDKKELDLLKGGYHAMCPGIFNKLSWNENSIYIGYDLMDIIEDILEKSNDEFSIFEDFSYFSIEQINKFEFELSIKINDINNNKKIVFDADSEYLNKKIEEHKEEVIEMLNKLFSWIKLNKINGITIIKKFYNFKILKRNDLPDGCGGFLEFLPGEFKKKCWNDNSVFIEDGEIDIVDDLLKKVNNEYDLYGCVYFYDENLLEKLENELQNRLNEIINNGYVSKGIYSQEYYDHINRYMELYKNEIIEMLDNFILWIKLNKSNGITVIGM